MSHICILVADKRSIYEALDEFANYDDGRRRKNPMFDYFGLGGRFEGTLTLIEPRKLKKFFGLINAGTTKQANTALKCEIDSEPLLENPPNMLFFDGKLHKSKVGFFDNPAEERKWKTKFAEIFSKIPDSELLQIVDAHI
ncbi:MAG: hypothetical protein IPO40_23865 [Fibrobacteres bacterium]|nr:hypothetical protein [Fibrobacterota bacterium]